MSNLKLQNSKCQTCGKVYVNVTTFWYSDAPEPGTCAECAKKETDTWLDEMKAARASKPYLEQVDQDALFGTGK